MQFEDDPIPIKVLVVGDTQSGKSSFVNRFVKDKYDNLNVSQINCKEITYDGDRFKIDLWDYGQASNIVPYINVIPNIFVREATAAIVVVDLSVPEEKLKVVYTKAYEWREIINKKHSDVNGPDKTLKWMLCLHKSDAILTKEHRKVISSILNKVMKVYPKFD